MKPAWSVGVALLLVAASSAASATQVSTSFLAREKPITRGMLATDSVTATLYADAACTSFLAEQVLAIENVVVREYPPHAVRLYFWFTLESPPVGELHLRVTSDVRHAIVGIPTDCQRQTKPE